ncbi:mediator of RNA polymeras-like protein II transcription subunit 5 [Bimuria novae-zelandiae CBS 107.79]|uniref:Mediator of RNA polymerase II transcription subunit 5 n=1 Tax=Bimuria novae-zelandiae CBS 107.79 TaxID=1447943 RepID=A0A6A5V7R3_9PLEO|nr:mediator of RNA polymeras-like protein II transcription subunit 5 [Bimuria novae-zelandiae CBS 107.79]
MDSLVKEWDVFFTKCLENRIPVEIFAAAATQLHARSPVPGQKLAGLLLKPRAAGTTSVDPRVIVYVEQLLTLKKVDAFDVLVSAFYFSKDRPIRAGDSNNSKSASGWRNPPQLDELIFHRLHKAFSGEHPERPVIGNEGLQTVKIVTRWMSAMVTSHTSDSMIQAMAGIQQQPQEQSINVREGLGMLAVGLIENSKILQLLTKDQHKDIRTGFVQALTDFIPFVSQTHIQIANRLEIFRKEHDLSEPAVPGPDGETNGNAGLDVAALQLEAVIDLPQINTRAGLFIFLNALLVARPLTDDVVINNYLQACYKMDAQNMATDLVTASFDILANAMYRNESTAMMTALKSFLINKIPIHLSQLTASVYPMNPELCITQALGRIDPNAFPAFSQGFDDMLGSNPSLADVRQDFLNACSLHGLISSNTVERLLGEAPMQGPPSTKYTRQELLKQCKNNFDKAIAYIEELENLDGNAGAIVTALTDFISHLCDTQMTMYLKTLCNALSKKTQALDVILQFTSPASVLRPLCSYLDSWRYESDQEYQPVYDEFSAILVLVLAFTYRYELSYHDLGITHDSFVAQLLERGHRSLTPNEMNADQDKHLSGWLCGLFDADKDGLSNDVFASCRPQDFYLIVPTLFSQIVLGCDAEVLSLESVKGGLEYLHETFLLPSLVGGLIWMASRALVQTHQEHDVLMQIFHKLIRSAPTSGDAQAMHSTILSIVSARLEGCFRTLKKRYPKYSTDIEQLLQAIKPNQDYVRSSYSPISELDHWTTATNNTLTTSLRHTVQQLSQWSNNASLQPNPPSYTHRQIYTCIRLLGASKTLGAIIDEVKAQTDAGNGPAALDIGASLICAPMTENSVLPVGWVGSSVPAPQTPRTQSNLREMLKSEFDNAASIVSTDPSAAETIVRLHRRVEAQLAVISQAGLPGHVDLANVNMVQAPSLPSEATMNDAAAASIAGADMADMNKLQQNIDQQLDLGGTAPLDLSAMGVDSGTGDMSAGMSNLPDLDLDMGDMGMGMGMEGGDEDWGLDFDNM